MNPNKFHHRVDLFSDILYEIFNVESNYRTELSVLNLKLLKKIEEHKNKIKEKLKQEKFRQSTSNTKGNLIKKNSDKNIRTTLKTSKSKDNLIEDKEDNPMVDKLISEGLQQLLYFYKNKHKLISKEVSKLGIILYEFSSSQKKYDTNEELMTIEKYQNDFEMNFTKLMINKKRYLEKMNNLELYLHEKENQKNNKNIDKKNDKDENKNDVKNDNKNDNKNKIDDNSNEKEKIEELIKIRNKYKNYVDEINKSQRTYIAKINEIGNDIQEFNITENNILFNLFKVFEEHLILLLKEVNNFCRLYDHNKKLIKDLNLELGNNIIYDNRLYVNYQFEEYSPKFTDINNQKDYAVIQKMNKLIGFEYDKIKSDNSNRINNNEKNDNNKYKNIDNNLLFLLLMDKLTGGESALNEKEKKLMKNLLEEEKYVKEFLNKLNKIRINRQLFNNKERFNVLLEFFNVIYSKVSFSDKNSHELAKFLMILSETFFYNDGDNKIFLNNVITIPKELKDTKFWINYINLEIEFEYKKYVNKKNSRYEYIVLLSNTTHLKEYMVDKEKVLEIINYFKDKCKLTDDEIEVLKEQLQIV